MFDAFLFDPIKRGVIFAYGFTALLVVFVSQKVNVTHPEFQRHLIAFPVLIDALKAVAIAIAVCLGALHRRHFGRAGRWGVLRSWAATVDIAVLTAATIGALVMPLTGAMYGPLVLGLTILDQPALLILFLAAATLGHVAASDARSAAAGSGRPVSDSDSGA